MAEKFKVYRMNLYTEGLDENIRRKVWEVAQEELFRVNFNLFKRYREYARVLGYFQHLLQANLFYYFIEKYLPGIGKIL
jgi:hypothetical protein